MFYKSIDCITYLFSVQRLWYYDVLLSRKLRCTPWWSVWRMHGLVFRMLSNFLQCIQFFNLINKIAIISLRPKACFINHQCHVQYRIYIASDTAKILCLFYFIPNSPTYKKSILKMMTTNLPITIRCFWMSMKFVIFVNRFWFWILKKNILEFSFLYNIG